MGNESGTARRKMTSSRFVTPLGFSNGWAEFAPKNPPPFWPNILLDSQQATGPIGMLCQAPSSDPAVRGGFGGGGAPCGRGGVVPRPGSGLRVGGSADGVWPRQEGGLDVS